MPIYEYQCGQCGHQMEAFQQVSEAPIKTCPQCAQDTLQKLISATSFQLKGSGWYKTDYEKKSPPASETDNKTPAATDSKAATKATASDKSVTETAKTTVDKKSDKKSNQSSDSKAG